jgi:molecular chaperone GrpE
MTKKISGAAPWLQALNCNQQLAAKDQEMRDTLLSFLEVLDAFDRFLSTVDQSQQLSESSQRERSSFDRIRIKLVRALEQAGVTFMDCQGKPFDPYRHAAVDVAQCESEVGENIVVEEIIRGCEWNGKLLRPAKVVVSKYE